MRDGAQQQLLQLSQELRGRRNAHATVTMRSTILQQDHTADGQGTLLVDSEWKDMLLDGDSVWKLQANAAATMSLTKVKSRCA